jgi:hypothetical protein
MGNFDNEAPSGLPWQVTLSPYRSEPFEVSVQVGHRVSVLLGRDVGYSQERALLVAVTYQDGKRAAKVVPIPDGRASHTLVVCVP